MLKFILKHIDTAVTRCIDDTIALLITIIRLVANALITYFLPSLARYFFVKPTTCVCVVFSLACKRQQCFLTSCDCASRALWFYVVKSSLVWFLSRLCSITTLFAVVLHI